MQYSGPLGHTANDGNHKLLTYLIELFCPINLLSDTTDTRDGNESVFTLHRSGNFNSALNRFFIVSYIILKNALQKYSFVLLFFLQHVSCEFRTLDSVAVT